MHNNGRGNVGGSTFFQELCNVKFVSLILVTTVLVILPTYWMYGDQILNGPKQKGLDTLVDGLFEDREYLVLHPTQQSADFDFMKMLEARKCALADIEPFGLEKYPVPVEDEQEEPAVNDDSEQAPAEGADTPDSPPATDETVGDDTPQFGPTPPANEATEDTTPPPNDPPADPPGGGARRLQDDPPAPENTSEPPVGGPATTASPPEGEGVGTTDPPAGGEGEQPVDSGEAPNPDDQQNTEEQPNANENADPPAAGEKDESWYEQADGMESNNLEVGESEDPSTYRKSLAQTKCTVDYMFSLRPQGSVKMVQDSETYYTGAYKPPKGEILNKWNQLKPLTYDFIEKIYTGMTSSPIAFNSIQGNSEWVEDVYMKIGDSMFFYTGMIVNEKAEGFGRFYNEYILAEGQVSGGQEQGILRVIREDGSYEIGQVVGRAWSWFNRYDKDDCLIAQKTEKEGKKYDIGQNDSNCGDGYEKTTWEPEK